MKRLLCLILTFFLAFSLCASANALSVEQAITLLEENYVDVLSPEVYRAQSLEELFALLGDEYTYYMTAEQYSTFLNHVERESSVCGIGISASVKKDGLEVVLPIAGGSAAEAGMVSGDYIIAVDGVSCVPADENTTALIQGEEGTFVTITVRHEDGSVQDYTLERRHVTMHNTNAYNKNGVTTIECNSFGTNTDQYFLDAITQYQEQTHLWEVDLRGNGGGVAESAAYAIGAFAGRGPVLFFRDRNKNCSYHFFTDSARTSDPVIVLVDSASASASEIFAAGIRGTKSGIVIGSRTYGKGVAQTVLDKDSCPEYFDGDGLKVTVYRFYAADRTTTDHIGVIPTLFVPADYAGKIAGLLCAPMPEDNSDHLRLRLNGVKFYLDLNEATSEANLPYFKMLLEALPPNADITLGNQKAWDNISVKDLRERYGVSARTLTDVAGCDYDIEIDSLITYGIVQGDENGAFRPHETLSRAELCAMIAQALNVQGNGNFFADVAADSWYAGSVNAAALLGLVSGDGNGGFDPESEVSYAEMITVMGRLAMFLNFSVDLYASDLEEATLARNYRNLPQWSRVSADTLAKSVTDERDRPYNMLGTDPTRVDANETVTREIAAATLYRVLRYTGEIAY